MKRTREQVNNIRRGCEQRDVKLIVNAQKRRHLRTKINELIIKAIQEEKSLEHAKDWVYKLHSLSTITTLQTLFDEINKEVNQRD